METTQPSGLERSFIGEDYQALFARQWAPWVGGILIGLINVMMFAYAKPWGVADGVGNWGNWILLQFGAEVGDQAPITLYTTSVTNLSLIFGAFIAALLSRQFAFRLTTRRDLIRGLLGGILLGIGSVLGMGCTIGGFLSAFSALSLAGPLFMLGLFGGAYVGLKLLMMDLARESVRQGPPPRVIGTSTQPYQPLIALALIVLVAIWLFNDSTEFTYRGITALRSGLVFFGLMLGLINQRSRFCFVRAFREPYMTGDGSMAKAGAIALLVGLVGFSVLKGTDLADFRGMEEFVNPSVWIGSLSGGLIFGIGMVFTGGCASGSLWRAGEGQLKFFGVLLMFALVNAGLTAYFRVSGVRDVLNEEAYFAPDLWGWSGALIIMAAIPIAWIVLAAWNGKSEKLVVT